MRRTLVWDVPVRLFHWLLAAGFVAAWVLAETRDDDDPTFVLHMAIGLVVGLMAVLRILWGLVGTEHARFWGFALSPVALFRYMRGLVGKPGHAYVGHNPASSYATLILIGCGLGLAITGTMLARGHERAEDWHEAFATGFLLVSIVHVIGVAWHAIRYRDGIALGIIDGKKVADPERPSVSSRTVAGLVFVVLVGGWAGALLAGYDATGGTIDVPGVGWTLGGDDDDDDEDEDRHRDRGHRDRDHRDRDHRDRDHRDEHRRRGHDHHD